MAGNTTDTSEEAALAAGGADYLVLWRALPRCVGCERPLRPVRGVVADWPATISRQGSSKTCGGCYRIGVRDTSKSEYELGSDGAVPVVSLREIAEQWSAEQRSVALLVCERATSAADAREMLDCLGLWSPTDATVGATLMGLSIHPLGESFSPSDSYKSRFN